MFWGLIVQPNKKYSKTVSTPFHVSQAVLDTTTISDNEFVQLILKSDKVDYILCTLRKSDTVQVPLDLIFSAGDEISFRSVGGTVHLTGYLVDDDDEFADMNEPESSDAEEEVPTLVPAPKQKQQKNQAVREADSSSENENSAEEDGSDDDDEEADDDSDEEEVDDSDDEAVEPPPAKIQKTNGMPNGVSKKEDKHKDGKQKKQQQQQQTQDKSAKILVGGVKAEDLRVGQGPVAKQGKKVTVYYEGRLKSNNKVFDKTNSGKGFEFTLGKQEVIRGWDIGVQGMKVGGKRRIVCPANTAYGSKGSPPVIPPNSTLVFDIELRGVN